MNKQFLYLVMIFIMQAWSTAQASDWRKTGSNELKLDNVVKVMPGASTIMLQMGERYKNLYWAAKQEKWTFAEYQVEEMESLLITLMITRPKRASTTKHFLNDAFDLFPAAIKNKRWQQFTVAFEHMRKRCMTCHEQNKHEFIVLPAKPSRGNSLVLDAALVN